MGLSSDNKRLHGFRSDSNRNTPTDSNRFRSSEAGMGWEGKGRVSRYKEWKPNQPQEMAPLSERNAREFAFAKKALPDQHLGFCVAAMLSLQVGGETPTREKVLERLRATGREASQIGYGPGGEAA